MTGWRLGYIAAPKWLADACIKMQGQSTSGASSFGQYAAVTALLADLSPSREMCAEFRKRRDLLIGLFAPIQGLQLNTPEGAFYFFPDISYFLGKSFQNERIDTAEALCLYLLNEYGVALVSGEGFGAPTCLRISYATSEELLRKAVERIKAGLEALV
jgi:aspartate aminotransferase